MEKNNSISLDKVKPPRKSILDNEAILPYLFIAPATILIVVFLFYPVLNVFYYSLQVHNPIRPWADGFVGLDNFRTILFSDRLFRSSLVVSFRWVVAQISLQLFFGMIVALILNRVFWGRGLVRTIMFYPWALSGVLTAMMWNLMYNQHMGVINGILTNLGIIDRNIAWLGNIDTVFPAVVIAQLWRGIPFFAIMLLARLQTISTDIYEAADVDGASSIQKFIYITLPHLKEAIILATLLRAIWEFNSVDLIMNLTGGGPAHATTTLSMYIVNTAISDMEFGYGSALATISFFLLFGFALLYLKLSGFNKED